MAKRKDGSGTGVIYHLVVQTIPQVLPYHETPDAWKLTKDELRKVWLLPKPVHFRREPKVNIKAGLAVLTIEDGKDAVRLARRLNGWEWKAESCWLRAWVEEHDDQRLHLMFGPEDPKSGSNIPVPVLRSPLQASSTFTRHGQSLSIGAPVRGTYGPPSGASDPQWPPIPGIANPAVHFARGYTSVNASSRALSQSLDQTNAVRFHSFQNGAHIFNPGMSGASSSGASIQSYHGSVSSISTSSSTLRASCELDVLSSDFSTLTTTHTPQSPESHTVVIRNLHQSTTKSQMHDILDQNVKRYISYQDMKLTEARRGHTEAYITFSKRKSADCVAEKLNGLRVKDRELRAQLYE